MQEIRIQQVVRKLQTLTPERLAEVEAFIEFLAQRDADRGLTRVAMAASEPALDKVWNNADDAEYDHL
jgi:hypothetical protein